MNAVRRLEAVACDGYRSACSRARFCDRLPCTLLVGRLVCFDGFIFIFPVAVLPSGFVKFLMSKKDMKNSTSCSPKNDSTGPTLELKLSSAIRWIEARVACRLRILPAERTACILFLVMSIVSSPLEKDTHGT